MLCSHLSPLYFPFKENSLRFSNFAFSYTTCHCYPLCFLSIHLLTHLLLAPTAIHSLKLSRTHVDWHSVEEVYLYSDATTSKIARTVTQKLGFSKGE